MVHCRLQLELAAFITYHVTTTNRLSLPTLLKVLIVNDRWKTPSNLQPYQEVFSKNHIGGWFLTPDQMERHTKQLRYIHEEGFGAGYALSTTDRSEYSLNLSKAICLGDTGPEEPICLVYRNPEEAGTVVYLADDHNNQPNWITIASSIEEFAKRLGL